MLRAVVLDAKFHARCRVQLFRVGLKINNSQHISPPLLQLISIKYLSQETMPNNNRNTTYSTNYEKEFVWVTQSKQGKHWACCKWCNKDIDIRSMGRQALVSHSGGKKHELQTNLHTKTVNLTAFIPKTSTSSTIPNPPLNPPELIRKLMNDMHFFSLINKNKLK